MGYSGARGGQEAIAAAERLVRDGRDGGATPRLGVDQVIERLRLGVDRVMGEGGLWAPDLAARAIRQAEGDVQEAAQLLRAHRSTLPRLAYSEPVRAEELRVVRRISSAFRNPPGSQILGRTLDYVGRLLDLMPDEAADAPPAAAAPPHEGHPHAHTHTRDEEDRHPPRLLGVLRNMDMLVERRTAEDPEPYDITRVPARPGAPRSARLTAMARAETGALVHLWYAYTFDPLKHGHEIPGEVRHGWLPVRVAHPLTGNPVQVARVRATDVETLDDLDRPEEDRTRLDAGYGMCFGHNERKAIAMAGMDLLVHRDGGRTSLDQYVLVTLDGIESAGFLEHLKLPHYVDFRSTLDRKRAVRKASREAAAPDRAPAHAGGAS
ncbi:MAG TPA: carbon-phosphorus lyase complex subunit PhnI [Streptosporangiaceae bacterium]|jgi:alpha-D-ribose 1-methylphosphonate 5-triphosphate synthase subunit PhnI